MRLGLGTIALIAALLAGCTSEKCDPKSGESCKVLPETIGLSAFEDPTAPAGTPALPQRLELLTRLGFHSEVMVRDGGQDVVSLLYLPFSFHHGDGPGFLARLAGARGYSFSRPQLPEGCSISHLGYSHLQTDSGMGILEFSSREPKDGPKPCLKFFRQVEKEGLDVQFADVPVYRDRPPVQIQLQAAPLPERPRTAVRTRGLEKRPVQAD